MESWKKKMDSDEGFSGQTTNTGDISTENEAERQSNDGVVEDAGAVDEATAKAGERENWSSDEEDEGPHAGASDGGGSGDGSDEEEGGDDDEEEVDSHVSQGHTLRPVEQQQQPPQPQPERSGILGMIKALLIRMVFIYMVSTLVQRGRQPATDIKKEISPVADGNDSTVSNLFPKDMLMDMYVYISENKSMQDASDGVLFWFKKELRYGDWESCQNSDETCEMQGVIEISEAVRANGLLFLHVYFVKSGQLLSFTSYDSNDFVFGSQCLTRFYRERETTQSQLSDVDNKSVTEGVKVIPYWGPKMMFGLITDHSNWKLGSVPSPLDNYIRYVPDQPYYYPLVYFSSYWNLDRDYVPINSSTQTLNLTLSYSPLSLFRWRIYPIQSVSSLVCPSFEKNRIDDNGQDFIKMAFLDNGLFLLIAVSLFPIVHVVLSFLAFRNEVSYWSQCSSMEGVSVFSALSELITAIILSMYIIAVETAFIFTLTAAVDVLIATWKMTKVLNIQVTFQPRLFWIFPRVKVLERPTYISSQTRKYDRHASVRVSYMLCPILAIYIGYAAMMLEYKNWYIWTLTMMHGFLTSSLGLFMMMPQIFINYKFKSTTHLPWRALTYKAIDAFLDGACALVIQAPSYYRIGFFRYNQLYCIYLYQYWRYRQNNASINNGESNGNNGLQETTS